MLGYKRLGRVGKGRGEEEGKEGARAGEEEGRARGGIMRGEERRGEERKRQYRYCAALEYSSGRDFDWRGRGGGWKRWERFLSPPLLPYFALLPTPPS